MAADPRHADFGISALHQVRCVDADLRGARLVRADLREADFSRADLREANLRKARAHDAVFAGADLRMADLRGRDPRGADLRQAALEGALASDRTSWPHGFDPRTAGVVISADPGAEPDNVLPAAAITRQAPPLQSALRSGRVRSQPVRTRNRRRARER